MRIKNSTMVVILLTVFVITCGMFFYQNFYLKNQLESSGIIVYVAKQDILAGDEFGPENIGAIKTNKIPNNYILDFNDDLRGKTAKTNIYKNEAINRERISLENKNTDAMFNIKIKASQASDFKKNDIARFYVQIYDKKDKKISIFELFDKRIMDISTTTNQSKGTSIDGFFVLVSDEEAINYYNATKIGEIIALKFNDIEEENKMKIAKFDISSPELEYLGIDFSAIYKTYDPMSVVNLDKPKPTISYVIKKEDTWESVASLYGTTIEQLKIDNPDVSNLSEGQIINISYWGGKFNGWENIYNNFSYSGKWC